MSHHVNEKAHNTTKRPDRKWHTGLAGCDTTSMATKPADEPLVQLSTRVPEALSRRVKVHCVQREVSVMEFVAEALREKLRRVGIRTS